RAVASALGMQSLAEVTSRPAVWTRGNQVQHPRVLPEGMQEFVFWPGSTARTGLLQRASSKSEINSRRRIAGLSDEASVRGEPCCPYDECQFPGSAEIVLRGVHLGVFRPICRLCR